MRYGLSALLSALSFAATPVWSQARFAEAAPVSGLAGMAQMFAALALVLVVLFALAWLLRRIRLPRTQQGMRVVQGISLGPKERAIVIEVEQRRLLLGVGSGSVNLLAELAPPVADSSDSTATVGKNTEPPTPNFKALLRRSMGLS